jgi:hypothetical protein
MAINGLTTMWFFKTIWINELQRTISKSFSKIAFIVGAVGCRSDGRRLGCAVGALPRLDLLVLLHQAKRTWKNWQKILDVNLIIQSIK